MRADDAEHLCGEKDSKSHAARTLALLSAGATARPPRAPSRARRAAPGHIVGAMRTFVVHHVPARVGGPRAPRPVTAEP